MIDRFKLLYDGGADKISLSDNPNLTTEQIDLLYENEGTERRFGKGLRVNLAQYPKLTEKQFMRFFNDGDFNKVYLSANPHLTPEQIDLLYQTKGVKRFYLTQKSKLTDEQFMRFFNNHPDMRIFLSANPNLTPEQIDLLYEIANKNMDSEDVNLKVNLARYPKLSEEQFLRLFLDDDLAIKDKYKERLASNPHLTPEQIDLLYDSVKVRGKNFLAKFPKLTEEQFMRAFNDDTLHFNKDYLALNPNLTTEQIDLLYDAGEGVDKDALAQFSKLTDEQFLRAFNDGKTDKDALATNPSINPPANQQFASGIFNWRW